MRARGIGKLLNSKTSVANGHFAQLRGHWAKLLRERYPELFTTPRPLAVGIYHQIRAAIGRDELRNRDLNLFLAGWTKWPAYRAALVRGDRRVNLDGSDAGPALAEPRAA